MCLVTRKPKQIAKENITCYKVVHLIDNVMFSYYYDFKYILNKVYKIKDMFTYRMGDHTCIEKAFHSYASLEAAMEFRDLCFEACDYNCIIVKCTIPKGAEYYANIQTIASNQIIILSII